MAIAFRRSGSPTQNLSREGSGTLFDITGNITIMAWFKMFSLPGGGEEFVIMSKDTDSSTQAAYLLDVSGSDVLRFRRSTNGSSFTTSLSGATALTAGVWHLGMGWWDGATQKVYLDTVQDATTGSTGATFDSSAKFRIGDRDDQGKALDADLADVRIYDRALSLSEIRTIYTKRGRDNILGGLVARWKLKDLAPGAVASRVYDHGPDGLGLAVNGTPVFSEDILTNRRRGPQARH